MIFGMYPMENNYPKSASVDILLLLEGTYPFVFGGVSAWVHNLVTHFKQFNFGIVFLGGQRSDYGEACYQWPENVKHLEVHYLFDDDYNDDDTESYHNDSKAGYDKMTSLHKNLQSNSASTCPMNDIALQESLFANDAFTRRDFLYSETAWNYIVHEYSNNCPNISFLDYFWMVRNMHMPIWRLLRMIEYLPKTKIFHSVSTGYAGFLGGLLKIKMKNPFVLTEHGIYVKERKIDLLSHMTAIGNQSELLEVKTQEYLTEIGIGFFETLARICYLEADPIISLFAGYRNLQIEDGAPVEKTMIIPNGVFIQPDDSITRTQPTLDNPIIALIGRVVPIKDIKTFIRSMILIVQAIPKVQAWIIGPTSEDETYYAECLQLVNVLNLNDSIKFLGKQNMAEIYNKIDLSVLSSISEGLPLVLLESFSYGIPVVATNVGACSELIYGASDEDKALGSSGMVVEIATPNVFGQAVVTMLQDKSRWHHAQLAARARVKRYYGQSAFIENYTKIYDKAIQSWRG